MREHHITKVPAQPSAPADPEVEVDREKGQVEILKHSTLHDHEKCVNLLLPEEKNK
jgi:hypothetical protein